MYVDNEITDLKKVIVHFPDSGISRISPKRAESLLFDDIVFYPLMHKEYGTFLKLMHLFVGQQNVLEVEDLIHQALAENKEQRLSLINKVIDFEELPPSYSKYLEPLDDKILANTLITGYLREEDRILFDPLPNYMFTRDIAVCIKDHILISKAAKEARHRENLLSWFIFKNHPMFSTLENKIIDLNNLEAFPPSRRGEVVCAEGGDIMMFDKDHLLIGCSERTSNYAFEKIKEVVFELGLVKYVAQVNIPNDRSFMHIDTLFTRVDKHLTACHKPIVYDGAGSNVQVFSADGESMVYPSIKDYILERIDPDMKFVFSGGGISPYQEREQWTDSCNLVAIRPGVGIAYDRNLKTLSSFEKEGYKIIDAEDIFQHQATDPTFAANLQKAIITIPSSELSRARGGSHCMTCPIERLAI